MSEAIDVVTTLVKTLRRVGYALVDANLQGNLSENAKKRSRRIYNPQPGDIILETSSYYTVELDRKSYWATIEETIGFLECKTREPIGGYWEETEDDPRPDEEVWYIRRFRDNELVRWTNANFVAISWESTESIVTT